MSDLSDEDNGWDRSDDDLLEADTDLASQLDTQAEVFEDSQQDETQRDDTQREDQPEMRRPLAQIAQLSQSNTQRPVSPLVKMYEVVLDMQETQKRDKIRLANPPAQFAQSSEVSRSSASTPASFHSPPSIQGLPTVSQHLPVPAPMPVAPTGQHVLTNYLGDLQDISNNVVPFGMGSQYGNI